MSGNETFVLSNEFAEVRVEWETGEGDLRRLKITDLGSGAMALLDPQRAVYPPGHGHRSRAAEVSVSLDYVANGPRLKIGDAKTGSAVYLDPLQLADAAMAGAWGKLPPIYEDSTP